MYMKMVGKRDISYYEMDDSVWIPGLYYSQACPWAAWF